MHLKVFLKLKTPKNSLFWVKKTTGLVFFFNPGFFQPWTTQVLVQMAEELMIDGQYEPALATLLPAIQSYRAVHTLLFFVNK